MRLIDADALYNRFWERAWYDNADRDECACVDVDNAPTVDAVVVVRCKGCKYFDKAAPNDKGFCICPASGMEIVPDDFCSYGEPKER